VREIGDFIARQFHAVPAVAARGADHFALADELILDSPEHLLVGDSLTTHIFGIFAENLTNFIVQAVLYRQILFDNVRNQIAAAGLIRRLENVRMKAPDDLATYVLYEFFGKQQIASVLSRDKGCQTTARALLPWMRSSIMQPSRYMTQDRNRRSFLRTAAATASTFTIVPRHVLGGQGVVAPSDKITLAYIGVGTQGLREMIPLLAAPEIQIVSVCDPSKYAVEYRDWTKDGLLNTIRRALGKPTWAVGGEGAIPGGRDAGKDIVETYYASKRPSDRFRGIGTYADYRELLDKEKDLNAVKIMTPDHLHAVISIAAMKKGKHVIMHKPIANRLKEAKLVIETARERGVATHFMPWDSNGSMQPVLAWIKEGAIGTLREVHNWTNRPMWPQYAALPVDRPPVPKGFDWDLWLGPETDRPYHPHYTHMTFRGWYDFGGGSMADMGHYSLWTVFNALELTSPTSIEPMLSHDTLMKGGIAAAVKNDFSFPAASIVRFKFPARGERPAVDLIWYEGGMRPPTPPELEANGKELPAEAMMFVGDKGRILAGFRVENPRVLSEKSEAALPPSAARRRREPGELSPGLRQWVSACKGGKPSPGNFLGAGPLSEAVNLYAVALRTGRRLAYDGANMKITNIPEANKYLAREYRKGWDPGAL
jgi:hypothetical protein